MAGKIEISPTWTLEEVREKLSQKSSQLDLAQKKITQELFKEIFKPSFRLRPQLRSLQKVNVSRCQLCSIHHQFLHLPLLQELILDDNNIQYIPIQAGRTALRLLSLVGNSNVRLKHKKAPSFPVHLKIRLDDTGHYCSWYGRFFLKYENEGSVSLSNLVTLFKYLVGTPFLLVNCPEYLTVYETALRTFSQSQIAPAPLIVLFVHQTIDPQLSPFLICVKAPDPVVALNMAAAKADQLLESQTPISVLSPEWPGEEAGQVMQPRVSHVDLKSALAWMGSVKATPAPSRTFSLSPRQLKNPTIETAENFLLFLTLLQKYGEAHFNRLEITLLLALLENDHFILGKDILDSLCFLLKNLGLINRWGQSFLEINPEYLKLFLTKIKGDNPLDLTFPEAYYKSKVSFKDLKEIIDKFFEDRTRFSKIGKIFSQQLPFYKNGNVEFILTELREKNWGRKTGTQGDTEFKLNREGLATFVEGKEGGYFELPDPGPNRLIHIDTLRKLWSVVRTYMNAPPTQLAMLIALRFPDYKCNFKPILEKAAQKFGKSAKSQPAMQ